MIVSNSSNIEYDVEKWKDIVEIDADSFMIIGIQSDGTALLVGEDAEKSWFSDVFEWESLMVP